MVLIKNYKDELDKKQKFKEYLGRLNAELSNSKILKKPSPLDEIEYVKPDREITNDIIINDELEKELENEELSNKKALENLKKITSEANAQKFIEKLNSKDTSYIKYFNMIFPKLQKELTKNFKNVSLDFFINYAIGEINKTYNDKLKENDDIEEELDDYEERKDIEDELDEAEAAGDIRNISYRQVSLINSENKKGFLQPKNAIKKKRLTNFTGVIMLKHDENDDPFLIYVKKSKNNWYMLNEKKNQTELLNSTNWNNMISSIKKHDINTKFKFSEAAKDIMIQDIINKCEEYELDKYSQDEPLYGEGIKIKHGRGNDYVEFGNYRISLNKLNDNILNLQYKTGHSLNSFKNTIITDELKDIIKSIIDNKFNDKMLKLLSNDEIYLFEKIIKYSQVLDNYEVKFLDEQNKRDHERFQILKGELLAGNDNPKIKTEMKQILTRYLDNNKISQKEFLKIISNL